MAAFKIDENLPESGHGGLAMFQFTIRDLALLTVVAAMGVGWSLDRARLLDRIDELDGCQTIEEFLARERGSFQQVSTLP